MTDDDVKWSRRPPLEVFRQKLAEGHDNVREGESILARIRDEMRPLGFRNGFLIEERKPTTDVRTAILAKVAWIVERQAAGRWIAAATALTELRDMLAALAPSSLPSDERSWPDFARKHFPFDADALIGRMYQGGLWECEDCGAAIRAPCACLRIASRYGPGYVVKGHDQGQVEPGKTSALARAIEAVKADPTKSNRLIAKEIGTSAMTVGRAREHVTQDVTVETPRMGMDGRRRRRSSKDDSRWRALPPEGQGECDYNPETDKAFAEEEEWESRRNAANWQLIEAKRLAVMFSLLRNATQSDEITRTRITQVRRIAAGWSELAEKLERRRKGYAVDKRWRSWKPDVTVESK